MKRILPLLLSLLLLTGCGGNAADGAYQQITQEEAKEMMDSQEVIILDGGTYYLTYETAGQKIPTGNSIQLQVVYGGNGNLKESTANVSVTLNPKPVTAVVENEITKFYDGEKNAAVTLAFGEGAILTGDEVNVSAPNAAYTTAEAGTGIAINFGSLTVTGKDAG